MIIDNPSDVHKSNKVVVYAQFLLQWLSSANQFEWSIMRNPKNWLWEEQPVRI